jgi:hypothetical protein
MPANEGLGSGVNIASKEKFAKVKHFGYSMPVLCASFVDRVFSTSRNFLDPSGDNLERSSPRLDFIWKISLDPTTLLDIRFAQDDKKGRGMSDEGVFTGNTHDDQGILVSRHVTNQPSLSAIPWCSGVTIAV